MKRGIDMHMADALLSPAVGITMCALSAGAVAYSAAKIKREELSEKRLPVMAVTGAFVFAAQMINFTIPGTGSSGHIGGGILLAALLGGQPALLAMAAVLLIQCLFFADGGLLALGCNIFNMGVLPCLLVYPLLYKKIVAKKLSTGRIMAASIASCVMGLQLGAFGVVLQTTASGITQLPFGTFVLFMQPIHLGIGVIEGIVTGLILSFVYRVRPELLQSAAYGKPLGAVRVKKLVVIFACMAIVVAGGLSLLASAYPDGLEWSMQQVTGSTELENTHGLQEAAAAAQDKTAFMPDYGFAGDGDGSAKGTVTAGLIGTAMTFVLAGGAGAAVYFIKKRKKQTKRP